MCVMRTTMRTVAVGATILLVLALSGCWSTKKFKVVSPTSTPIVYKNLMLVLSNKDGVAAIVFTDEIEYGVKYRYRYLPKHGKEEAGEGEVFEKYKRFPGNKPGSKGWAVACNVVVRSSGKGLHLPLPPPIRSRADGKRPRL